MTKDLTLSSSTSVEHVAGCVFCTDPTTLNMCRSCARSYDQDRARTDGGEVIGAMRWAANRVRRILRPLLVTPRKLSTLIAYIKAADDVASFVDTEGWDNGDAARSAKKFFHARAQVLKTWGVSTNAP